MVIVSWLEIRKAVCQRHSYVSDNTTVQFIEVAFDLKLFMRFVGEGKKVLNVFLK